MIKPTPKGFSTPQHFKHNFRAESSKTMSKTQLQNYIHLSKKTSLPKSCLESLFVSLKRFFLPSQLLPKAKTNLDSQEDLRRIFQPRMFSLLDFQTQ